MDDNINEAIKFVGGELKLNPDADKLKLINEASLKFDLNPMQTEFLTNKILLGQ